MIIHLRCATSQHKQDKFWRTINSTSLDLIMASSDGASSISVAVRVRPFTASHSRLSRSYCLLRVLNRSEKRHNLLTSKMAPFSSAMGLSQESPPPELLKRAFGLCSKWSMTSACKFEIWQLEYWLKRWQGF